MKDILTNLKLSKKGNSTGKFKGTIMYIIICKVKNQLKIYDIQVRICAYVKSHQ